MDFNIAAGDVNYLINKYDHSSYRDGKVNVNGRSISLNKIAKETLMLAENNKLNKHEINVAIEKLRSMKESKDLRTSNSIGARVKYIISSLIFKNSDIHSNTAKVGLTIKALERIQSHLDQAIPENSRKDYGSMIGKLDYCVDMLFNDAKIPDNKTVLIHVKEDNGMGDLMLAAKAINTLKKQFPKLEVQVSVEVATIKMEDAIGKICQETADAGMSANLVTAFDKRSSGSKEPDLLIVMPTHACQAAENVWKNFKKEPDRLMLEEYGWGGPLSSGGLGSASLGIFLEPHLASLSTTQTDGEGIAQLSSKSASNLILNGMDPKDYTSSNRLYFGYAHMPNPSAGFMKSIIEMNEADRKDIDFFMRTENIIPGANWKLQFDDNGMHFMDHFTKNEREVDSISMDFLRKNNISKVEVVKVKREIVEVENSRGHRRANA